MEVGYVNHFWQGEQPLLRKGKKSLRRQQPEGMYTRSQRHGGVGLPFSMPSSLTRLKSQLQALRGNEASVSWFYRIPTRRLDTKRHHAKARRVKQTIRYASPRMERLYGNNCF